MKKKELINYIMVFGVNANKSELEKLSVESLVMIKVKIEIEMMEYNCLRSN